MASLLPPGLPVLAVEMGRPESWCPFTGSLDRVVGVTHFGASAPGKVLAQELGFTPELLAQRLAEMLGGGS
jgi:transketolase